MTPETQIRYDAKGAKVVTAYALFHFVVMTLAGVGVLVAYPVVGELLVLPGAAWVVLTSMFVGAMFEEHSFVWAWEPLRLLAGLAMAAFYLKDVAPLWAVPLGGVLLFAYPLYRFMKERPSPKGEMKTAMLPAGGMGTVGVPGEGA